MTCWSDYGNVISEFEIRRIIPIQENDNAAIIFLSRVKVISTDSRDDVWLFSLIIDYADKVN